MWFVERMLDFIDNQQWHGLVHDPKSEAVFAAMVEQDDAARADGDEGTSLDALFAAWERQQDSQR